MTQDRHAAGARSAAPAAWEDYRPHAASTSSAKQINHAVGARILAGGFSHGEYDVSVIVDAPDEVSMAAVAVAIAVGGAVRAVKTTSLLSDSQWVAALRKAPAVSAQYRPARSHEGSLAARDELELTGRADPTTRYSSAV